MTGLHLTDLRKVSVEAVPTKALLLKYQALRPLYDHRHPGDIESAIAEQSLSMDMFVAEPALELLSLLGKYGPWRRNLHMAWRKLQSQSQSQWGKAVDRRISRQAIAQQPQERWLGHGHGRSFCCQCFWKPSSCATNAQWPSGPSIAEPESTTCFAFAIAAHPSFD